MFEKEKERFRPWRCLDGSHLLAAVVTALFGGGGCGGSIERW